MKVVVTVLEAGSIEQPYFKGEASDCPPLPRVGERIAGDFGSGEVTEVTHYKEETHFSIQIIFSQEAGYHEPTGF